MDSRGPVRQRVEGGIKFHTGGGAEGVEEDKEGIPVIDLTVDNKAIGESAKC